MCKYVLIPAVLLFASTASADPTLWFVGKAPGAANSYLQCLSQDGSIGAGHSEYYSKKDVRGFTWSAATGRYDWGFNGNFLQTPTFGMSSDGSTLAGYTGDGGPIHLAFRKVGDAPVEYLGILSGYMRSSAAGVSGDGQIVVGFCATSTAETRGEALRWTAESGMQGLGFVNPGDDYTRAYGISRDGSTIVGSSGSSSSGRDAFRWTETRGFEVLPDLEGDDDQMSRARATNADGSVVVGSAPIPTSFIHPVRWANGSIQDLAPKWAESFNGVSLAVSDSGGVVGGTFWDQAFLWTEASGMVFVEDYLAELGIEVPAPYRLVSVEAMSGDGMTFGGIAWDPKANLLEGYVVTIPSPGTLALLAVSCFFPRRRR